MIPKMPGFGIVRERLRLSVHTGAKHRAKTAGTDAIAKRALLRQSWLCAPGTSAEAARKASALAPGRAGLHALRHKHR